MTAWHDICAKHPNEFPGFVASVPMNNVKATLDEMTRAIEKLGARGIQIFTNVNGRPLDDPEFEPIFAKMADYDLPIWMHPTRPAGFADYPTEKQSKFDIWWVFGWPYETSAAMARMVFSGFFDKWPNLKIITHHLGAMAPFLEARIRLGLEQLGSRELAEPHYPKIIAGMKAKGRSPVDYFKMFYADTAINGWAPGIKLGLEFFGCDHVMFGTDCPFDPEGGPLFIRELIKAIDSLDLTEEERTKLYHANTVAHAEAQALSRPRRRSARVSTACQARSAGTPMASSRARLASDRASAGPGGKPDQRAQHDIGALLHAPAARHEEGGAFHRVGQALEHQHGDERQRRADEAQRHPRLDRRREPGRHVPGEARDNAGGVAIDRVDRSRARSPLARASQARVRPPARSTAPAA